MQSEYYKELRKLMWKVGNTSDKPNAVFEMTQIEELNSLQDELIVNITKSINNDKDIGGTYLVANLVELISLSNEVDSAVRNKGRTLEAAGYDQHDKIFSTIKQIWYSVFEIIEQILDLWILYFPIDASNNRHIFEKYSTPKTIGRIDKIISKRTIEEKEKISKIEKERFDKLLKSGKKIEKKAKRFKVKNILKFNESQIQKKSETKFSEKFYSFYHLMLVLDLRILSNFELDINDKFNRQEIENYGNEHYGTGQQFYREYLTIYNMWNKKEDIAKHLKIGYKKKIIKISGNDHRITNKLNDYPN